MREILFRGLHPCENGDKIIYVDGEAVKGKWIYGGYWLNDTVTRQTSHIIDDGNTIYVIPSTVGQCTGLTDKNGVKVFEGDILRHEWVNDDETTGDEVFKAVYQLGAYWAIGGCCSTLIGHYVTRRSGNHIQIIGNIHEEGGNIQ